MMFSRPDEDFNKEVNTRSAQLNANAVRLQVAPAKLTRVNNALVKWNNYFKLAWSGTSNSKVNTKSKNQTRKEMEAALRDVIKNTPEDLFTNADRIELNHPLRDAQLTPVDEKTYAPYLKHERSNHSVLVFRISDPEKPDTSKMPKGQRVLMMWNIGESRIANEATLEFKDAEVVTRFLKPLFFKYEDTGKWVYVKVCYVNNRGKKGPWSPLLSALVI